MNLLRQALRAGVKRVIITSSIASMVDPNKMEQQYSDRVLADEDWCPTTEEEALASEHEPLWNYCTGKVITEKEVWKFADAHPQMDVTTSKESPGSYYLAECLMYQ